MNLSSFVYLLLLTILFIYFLIVIEKTFLAKVSNRKRDLHNKKITVIKNTSSNSGKNNTSTVSTKKSKYHVPKFMLDLYEKNKFTKRNYTEPDVVKSLIPKHAGPLNYNQIMKDCTENHILIFDLPPSNADEKFVAAELKILTLLEITADLLVVERKLKLSIYSDKTGTLYHLKEVEIQHRNNTWMSFDVTEPVVQILRKNSRKKYLKFVVSITSYLPYVDNKLKLSLMPVDDNFEHEYPILLLSYTSNHNYTKSTDLSVNRKKRSVEEDYEEETNKIFDDDNDISRKIQTRKKRTRNSCRRKPLYINFADIDYDIWIVQPSGYEAYQCQGRCFYPVAEHLNPTKHAIIQALLHSVAPASVSRSCCVPTALDSISILYVDEHGVLTYRYAYKDMVVLECGCR